MEDQTNFLDDFVIKESEITAYERKSAKVRWVGLLVSVYALVVLLIPTLVLSENRSDNFIQGYFLVAVAIVVFALSIISAFLGFIIGVFIDKKYPYRKRYERAFWIAWFMTSAIYAIPVSITAFYVIFERVKAI